jgi:hypothetical protein
MCTALYISVRVRLLKYSCTGQHHNVILFRRWWRLIRGRWLRSHAFGSCEVGVEQLLAGCSTAPVSNLHCQPEFQVTVANLAQILGFGAVLTDPCAFVGASSGFPLEDGEWTGADSALLPIALLEHAHEGRWSIASLACNWEVGLLPALFINA